MKKYLAVVAVIALIAALSLNSFTLKPIILTIYNAIFPPTFVCWGDGTLIMGEEGKTVVLSVNVQKIMGMGQFTIPLATITVITPDGKYTYTIENQEMRLSVLNDIIFDAKSGFTIFIMDNTDSLTRGPYIIQFEIYDELGNKVSLQTLTITV